MVLSALLVRPFRKPNRSGRLNDVDCAIVQRCRLAAQSVGGPGESGGQQQHGVKQSVH